MKEEVEPLELELEPQADVSRLMWVLGTELGPLQEEQGPSPPSVSYLYL